MGLTRTLQETALGRAWVAASPAAVAGRSAQYPESSLCGACPALALVHACPAGSEALSMDTEGQYCRVRREQLNAVHRAC